MGKIFTVQVNGAEHRVEIEPGEHGIWQAVIDGKPVTIDTYQVSDGHTHLLIENASFDFYISQTPGETQTVEQRTYDITNSGIPHSVVIFDEHRRSLTKSVSRPGAGGDVTIKAPMPGLVVAVLVAPHEQVVKNQRIAVLEAMKMQNDLLAPRDGVIRTVAVTAGQAVNQGQQLFVIGSAEQTEKSDA